MRRKKKKKMKKNLEINEEESKRGDEIGIKKIDEGNNEKEWRKREGRKVQEDRKIKIQFKI